MPLEDDSQHSLHPTRIKMALNAIAMESNEDEKVFDSVHVETFKAALEFVRLIRTELS